MKKLNRLWMLAFGILFVMTCGCRSVKSSISQTNQQAHSEQKTSQQQDSVVYVKNINRFIYINGDTVRETIYRCDTLQLWHNRYDTIIVYDSIIDTQKEYIEKELTKSKQFWIAAGKWLMGIVVLLSVGLIIVIKMKPKRI